MSEKKQQQQPRQRRLDLIYDLPNGKQKEIARICNCTPGYVSSVLNGRTNQTSNKAINILRLAERSAEYERDRKALLHANRQIKRI